LRVGFRQRHQVAPQAGQGRSLAPAAGGIGEDVLAFAGLLDVEAQKPNTAGGFWAAGLVLVCHKDAHLNIAVEPYMADCGDIVVVKLHMLVT
jgi:hypothetical protein